MSAASASYSHIAVARKLRARRSSLTMNGSMFRSRKNRRKVDLAKKTDEVKASVKSHAPAMLKALGLTAVSVGLVFGGVKGWSWATTTERFAMRRVVVSGNTRVTEAQVTRLGNLVLGSNLLALDSSSVERALSGHPWVKSVELRRRLPETLSVQLVEHEPVALVSLADLYLVDRDGEPFKRAQATEAVDLPLITGIERDGLVSKRDETRARLRQALDAIDAYTKSAASTGHPISEVNVSDYGLTLVTTGGQELVLGQIDIEPALARLTRVRKELSARQVTAEVIRLDNRTRPDWVAVQPSKGTGRAP